MIATVVFFTEEGVLECMLVGDIWAAAMREGTRQVFVRAGTWFKVVEFVGSKGGGAQEATEEARSLGRIQDGCWGCWRVVQFAFIPESGLCL